MKKGEGANAAVTRGVVVLLPKLVNAFYNRPMAGPIREDAEIRLRGFLDQRTRDLGARRLKFASQAVHIVDIIRGPLAVMCLLVVTAPACEIGRGGMRVPGQCPVTDAVSVHVAVTLEVAETLELLLTENLPPLDGLLGVRERI